MTEYQWGIALHGGAGTIPRAALTPEKEAACHDGLARALKAGADILADRGSSLDAVEATVIELENDENFNAGYGSVLTSDATFELDAAIMRGSDLEAGAVIGVNKVEHPVSLARMIMEHSDHLMFSRDGAHEFARQMGVEEVEPDFFFTEYRQKQLLAAQKASVVSLDHNDGKYGTVGAVARDKSGGLAAATSTGGMTNKKTGRVGDAPLIGAGTYANDKSCAVSATGHGEMFIRMCVARDIAAMMEYGGASLEDAVRRKVMDELPTIDGAGGVVAIGHSGAPVLMMNTNGMYRATQVEGGDAETAIFAD